MSYRDWYRLTLRAALGLCLCVVVFGAYVRLTDAGLGCPDWPGCYGHLVLPGQDEARERAQARHPDRLLEAGKAWREMIHRYLATTLGMAIMLVAFLSWLNRRDPDQPRVLPLVLLGVVIFQGLLGMWTVTLLLKPLIVMAHLIGGLTTLGILLWLLLDEARGWRPGTGRRPFWPAAAALAVLVVQIALGGWTSANYAALACPDLPTCQGAWWPPEADFAEGFVLWRGLGIDYEGGVLEAPARVAIHYTHRLGALATLVLLILVAGRRTRYGATPAERTAGWLVVWAVSLQVLVGLGVVWFGLPLSLATAHNAGAALLLLTLLNLNHAAARPR